MNKKTTGFICGVVFTFICLVAILAPIGLITAGQQIDALTLELTQLQSQILDQAKVITAQQDLITAYQHQADVTTNVLGQAAETLEQIAYGPYTRAEVAKMIQQVADIVRDVNRNLTPDEVSQISNLIVTNAIAADVDPLILTAMAITESHFRTSLRGAAGEYGMLQVMPCTGRWIASRLGYADYKPEQMWDIKVNVQYAAYYLRVVTREFGGDTWQGVMAYNAGSRGAREWMNKNSVNQHFYVRRVQATYNKIRGA